MYICYLNFNKMKKIKTILIALFLIIIYTDSKAQDTKGTPNPFIHKLFTGGTVGLQFGSYTYINIAPIIGYRFNEYLACGVGPNYIFYRQNYYGTIYKTNIYGANFFTRIYFLKDIIPSIKDFYLHGEFEALSLETEIFDYNYMHTGSKRYWIGSVYGGAGIRQMLGERAFMTLTVLYNFNESLDNPFDPLVYRVGLEIGL